MLGQVPRFLSHYKQSRYPAIFNISMIEVSGSQTKKLSEGKYSERKTK